MSHDIKIMGVYTTFLHLFEPWTGPNGTDKPRYAVTLGLTYEQMMQLWNAEERLLGEKFPDQNQRPQRIERWIRAVTDGVNYFEGVPTCLYTVKATSKFPPGVWGPDAQRITDQGDARIFNGMLANVHLSPFYYPTPKKGVSWNLHNIQTTGTGVQLGFVNPDPGFQPIPGAEVQVSPFAAQASAPPPPPAGPNTQYYANGQPVMPGSQPPPPQPPVRPPAPPAGIHGGFNVADLLR